jgi:UDP-N-acetyl-D-mannosaminuronic acid dehydrogenase
MSPTDQNQKRHNQQYQVILSRFNKILVIRLGQLGLPVIKYVKEIGFDANGYDINTRAIDRA